MAITLIDAGHLVSHIRVEGPKENSKIIVGLNNKLSVPAAGDVPYDDLFGQATETPHEPCRLSSGKLVP